MAAGVQSWRMAAGHGRWRPTAAGGALPSVDYRAATQPHSFRVRTHPSRRMTILQTERKCTAAEVVACGLHVCTRCTPVLGSSAYYVLVSLSYFAKSRFEAAACRVRLRLPQRCRPIQTNGCHCQHGHGSQDAQQALSTLLVQCVAHGEGRRIPAGAAAHARCVEPRGAR